MTAALPDGKPHFPPKIDIRSPAIAAPRVAQAGSLPPAEVREVEIISAIRFSFLLPASLEKSFSSAFAPLFSFDAIQRTAQN
jgi:hypothetical protein